MNTNISDEVGVYDKIYTNRQRDQTCCKFFCFITFQAEMRFERQHQHTQAGFHQSTRKTPLDAFGTVRKGARRRYSNRYS